MHVTILDKMPSYAIFKIVYVFNAAIYRLGPPIDINTVVEEKSLTLSWQPPLLMLAPGVMLCYKISVNVTESLDPQNILTQFVSNCTYNTTYALSLSSIGINRCNGDYLIEIHVAGVTSAQVEGVFARIVEVISSIEGCSPTGIIINTKFDSIQFRNKLQPCMHVK